MAALNCRQVEFHFPACQSILKNLDLFVQTGEFAVILGGNESGKTTLISILSGLRKPTQGKVTVESDGAMQSQPQVGVVFQNPDQQMIAASVEEEIALGLELCGIPSHLISERVEALLNKFDLIRLRNRSPESLSGGQKQRVALAAVMANQPLFVLFDEPDSLLDAPARREFMKAVEEIRAECGIIWTTPHPMRLPEADSYYYLNNGGLSRSSYEELMKLLDRHE